ncbi:hypothetical protein DFH11DRAFT_1580104 [Phellopilus nigrolimitatus]|nr:hypothetical protein DFH11DRAFT_1580104 [Phellopilus nigrolimitatus]
MSVLLSSSPLPESKMTTEPTDAPPPTQASDFEYEQVDVDNQRMLSASSEALLEEIRRLIFRVEDCRREHGAVLRHIGEEILRSQQGRAQVEPRAEEDLKIAKDALAEQIDSREVESRVLAGTRNVRQIIQTTVDNAKHEHDAMLQHIVETSRGSQHVDPALQAQARQADELLRSAARARTECASREELEASALASTRGTVQLARTAVEEAQRMYDAWLQIIGEESLGSPQGRAQLDSELREAASKAKKDLENAEDEHHKFCQPPQVPEEPVFS